MIENNLVDAPINTVYNEITPIFLRNFMSRKPYVVNEGGTSSGKTYNILMALGQRLVDIDGALCTTTGEDLPNLKDGSIQDWETIIDSNPKLKFAIKRTNKSERAYIFKNGSKMHFKAFQTMQDAKNGKRDFLFVNEANGVKYEVAEELMLRTKYQTFIDYNPNAEFWVHDNIIVKPPEDVELIQSTWLDNPYCPENIIRKILSYKPYWDCHGIQRPDGAAKCPTCGARVDKHALASGDPYRWDVYGLGIVGMLEGVYPDWIAVDHIPEDYDFVIYGMDFGFTNDPTVVVACYYVGRNIFVKTIIYEYGMTNLAILQRLHALGIDPYKDIIYADSAEPKDIAELRRGIHDGTGRVKGFRVNPCVKGANSIVSGIQKVKEYKMHYLKSDVEIRKELKNYVWAKDAATGKALNIPIDKWNHIMDGVRYPIYTHSFRAH
jgi:phage terminase large subunit